MNDCPQCFIAQDGTGYLVVGGTLKTVYRDRKASCYYCAKKEAGLITDMAHKGRTKRKDYGKKNNHGLCDIEDRPRPTVHDIRKLASSPRVGSWQ